MSQQSEDDTERRSAVSNTRSHDNSRWQGPRPHGLSVMNHRSWRWGNTPKCTHEHAKTQRVARHTHTLTAVFSYARLAFRERLFTTDRKKNHTYLFTSRGLFFSDSLLTEERSGLYVQPRLINDQHCKLLLSHTWNLCVYYTYVCLCMYVCMSGYNSGMLVCERNVRSKCSSTAALQKEVGHVWGRSVTSFTEQLKEHLQSTACVTFGKRWPLDL